MARIRVPFITGPIGLTVAAPTFTMVPDSVQGVAAGLADKNSVLAGVPLGDPRLANVSVQIDVPDDEVTAAGDALDPVKIKAKYPGHWLVRQNVIK